MRAISIITYYTVISVSKMLLTDSEEPLPPENIDSWASAHRFEYVGTFAARMGNSGSTIIAWRHADKASFFCQYTLKYDREDGDNTVTVTRFEYDLVTEFAEGISLTTGSSMDCNFYPKLPGAYAQSFSDMNFDDRWTKHLDAEKFLQEVGGAHATRDKSVFKDAVVKAIQKETAYVRTLRFWPLRGPYWYFVRKRLRYNKPIETQFAKGMIKLPQELTVGESLTMRYDFLRPSQK